MYIASERKIQEIRDSSSQVNSREITRNQISDMVLLS